MAVRAEQIAACLHDLGHADSYTGDYDEGLRCLTEAIARFEAAGIRAGVVSGWCNMAVLLIRQGRLDEAEEAARRGIAGSEEIGSVFWRVRAFHSAGEMEQLRGRPLQAGTDHARIRRGVRGHPRGRLLWRATWPAPWVMPMVEVTPRAVTRSLAVGRQAMVRPPLTESVCPVT